MERLQQQIARAQRRLILQQWWAILVRCWFVTLAAAAIAIGVRKLWPFDIDETQWAIGWSAAALGLGLLFATAWTYWQQQSRFEAAVEIDRRFGLKERVASTMALSPIELETPAGRALVQDAMQRVDRIDVNTRFNLQLDRWTWLPLVPALVAFCLAMFVDARGTTNSATASASVTAAKQVKSSAEALQKKLAERKTEAKEKGLADAEDLFRKLEEGTKNLASRENVDRQKALVKLNDLAQDLEKRRQALGGDEQLKKQLNQLKNLEHGPAERLAQAVKKSDLQQALNELDKLKEQIAQGKLDDAGQKQLGEQLGQMEQALKKMADEHREAKENLQQQIEQKRQAGDAAAADKLQQQLDQLKQQEAQQERLGKLASKLGQASKSLQQGDPKAAQQSLDQLSEELAEMKRDNDELTMLDDAMQEIDNAKKSMNCKQCNGQGCKECQEGGDADGQPRGGRPGGGIGKHPGGQGAPPDDKTKTGFYDTKVKQDVGRGSGVVTDLVEGPNRKGQMQEEIKAQFESSRHESADPLTGQRLPHDYRDHAKKYFDALREGRK